nr:HU family DNA-binding protein [uncultured Prevotella sp.]
MTKADIINEVSMSTGIPKKEVSIVVEAFMEEVKKSLIEKKESVFMRGFGSFNIKHRAEKTARNISKNTTITIPAHDQPSFKPSKSFIEEMMNAK